MIKRSVAAAMLAASAGFPLMTQAGGPAVVPEDHGLTETVMTMRVRGDLTFGTDGVVREHHVATRLDPRLAAYVDQTIDRWKFQPVQAGGRPANGKTYFQMTLNARPQEGGSYEISVETRDFSDDPSLGIAEFNDKNSGKCTKDCLVSRPPPPAYPPGMRPVSARVMVHLYLNPDGSVADAVVAQSALYGMQNDDRTLRRQLERITLGYARHVRFGAGSGSELRGDTHRVVAGALLFQVAGAYTGNLGVWRLEQRSRPNIASWLVNDPDRWIGTSAAEGSGFFAMEGSKYKLVPEPPRAP